MRRIPTGILLLAVALLASIALVITWFSKPTRPIASSELSLRAPDTGNSPPTGSAMTPPPPRKGVCESFYEVACRQRGSVLDSTGSVQRDLEGEVEALRLYETLIHKHRDWTVDQIDEALVAEIYTEKRRKRLVDVFNFVSHRIQSFVQRQPTRIFSTGAKRLLVERIRSVELELPPPASLYSSEPDLFTKNDVYYVALLDGRKVIRVGGAYPLTARSWFNRVFTFAHELAHSIDPCELSPNRVLLSSYRKLSRCFIERGMMKAKMEAPGCSQDNPLVETFADWVATEITAEAIVEYRPKLKGYEDLLNSLINAVKDLCNPESAIEQEIQSHPSPKIRIDMIFSSSPRIRDLLGCSAAPQADEVCGF